MSESILRYPYSVPVPGGASEDPGSMFPTGHVDYIKFQAYKTNYNVQNAGRFNRALRDNTDYGKRKKSGPAIFLYMPNNLSVTYSPQYNQQNKEKQVKFYFIMCVELRNVRKISI